MQSAPSPEVTDADVRALEEADSELTLQRRLRDAANLFAALEERVGATGRDGVWAHPDVAPTGADLDDVLDFVERTAAGGSSASDDLDAALESILREADEGGSGAGGSGASPDGQ